MAKRRSRLEGVTEFQQTLYGDSTVLLSQTGLPPDSEGEQNVRSVCDAIALWTGLKCTPCTPKKSGEREAREDGADAFLAGSDVKGRPVQVTRANDPQFTSNAAYGDAEKPYPGGSLFKLIETQVEVKSQKTPETARAETILAIDVRMFHFVAFQFGWSAMRSSDQVATWWDVVLIGNTTYPGPKGEQRPYANCWSLRGKLPGAAVWNNPERY